MEYGMAFWQGSRKGGTRMSNVSELKLVRERVDLSTEQEDVLNSFAAENELIVPPRHATHDPLARDVPFIFCPPQPVPLAPSRAARGRARRALTVLALLVTAGWGAYVYQSSHPQDFEIISAWVSRLAILTDTATKAATNPPTEARPNDPTDLDPLPASNESAVSPDAERAADRHSNASDTNMSEFTRPAAAAPQTTGTSGSLARPVENVRNVSGEWRLDTRTETGDSSFQGLTLHYEMKLTQDGDRVAGVGTKVSENETGTGPGAQTPVTMAGTIAGDRLTLNVVELGTQPETRGKIVLLVEEGGTLQGRFSSNAAPASGQVEARRASPAAP
jgi:hypothetical protein